MKHTILVLAVCLAALTTGCTTLLGLTDVPNAADDSGAQADGTVDDGSADGAIRMDGRIATDGADASRDGGGLGPDGSDGNVPDVDASVPEASSDSGVEGAVECNATTCPTGCCDSNNHCVTTPTASACGAGGGSCVACATGQTCGAGGACSCGGGSCATGCCDGTGACVTVTNVACGPAGGACVACAQGQECDPQGKCVCDAASCPQGCCDSTGKCVAYAGQMTGQCGTGGVACAACASGQACGPSGSCTCTPTSCPGGCCDSRNNCVAPSAQSATACGSAGNTCGKCTSGQACSGGACTCGGTSCSGCCSNGTCVSSSNATCGLGGGACTACTTGQECSTQGGCACDATSCPTGCCSGTTCLTAESATACGTGGAACSACATGQRCNGTACICDATSCPNGCCNGNTCVTTETSSACGTGAAACVTCVAGQRCNGSACVCDPTSCPNGCCNGTTCVAFGGQGTGACGANGAACGGCNTSIGQSCNSVSGGGQCGCPAGTTNCGGTCVNTTNNANNCGRCGHPCAGGSCIGSLCQQVTYTTQATTISGLATDGTVVVWTDTGDNSVDEVPGPGLPKIVLANSSVASSPASPGIDTASGEIYWLNGSFQNFLGCTVRVPQGGVAGTPTVTSLVGLIPSSAHGLIATGSDQATFLVHTADVFTATCGGTVSTQVTTQAGISGKVLVVTPSRFAFGDQAPPAGGAQVDITGTGGSIAPVTNQSGVDYVATDGTFAYWATLDPAIRSAALNSTTAQTVLASTGLAVTGLAADGTNVYYATSQGINYVKVVQGVGAGGANTLTSTPGNFLTYVSGALYYSSGSSIFKIATP